MAKTKFVKLGRNDISTTGKFRLDVNRDKKKFSVTNITSFIPYGSDASGRRAFKTEHGETHSLIITKIFTVLKPDENVIDNHNVMTLIMHPDVKIGGMSIEDHKKLVSLKLKKPNPKFTITNIDKVEVSSFENERELISARSELYQDLSKEKLIWLCSTFGVPYRTKITDNKRYKIKLTKSLDAFLQKSSENVKLFNDAIKNIKRTEMLFYINELLNLGDITDIGGIYKVGNRPVGATKDHIITFYEQNAEIYNMHKENVIESLKGTNLI